MVCTKKFCSEQMDHFGLENGAFPCNSESSLRFFKKNFAEWKGLIGLWKF